MIALTLATAELMRLTCQLQAVTPDGSSYVGPIITASFQVPAYEQLAKKSETERQSNSLLTDADALGLPSRWTAIKNRHGSIVLEPVGSRQELTGMLVPKLAGGFHVFFANDERLNSDEAPITEFSGTCVQNKTADLAGDSQ
jgi:hypothetical protein